eukprot:GHUV01001541.1.p1 GENE.GHUV01001541.1~~GHUV01001541.1.p1  ORF type:complete len:451 (+),score=28.61 GHUV01001541.1:196-1548(+)
MTARTPAWRNVLAPSLMVLAAAITLIMAPGPAEAQNAPNFPDLLHAQQEQRSKWDRLGRLIWKNLKQIDLDFVRNGRIVPPGLPGSTVKSPTACGRVARIWIRMPFHDCGTYSTITGDGGCNGSLRKELPSTMPLIDGKGNVIFKDIFDSLGKDKARADVAFDPQRVENTGMAISTSFFFQMKFAAEKWGLTASWADVMVYSGHLSVAMCGGPHILFVPGRRDSNSADVAGALPAPTDGGFALVRSFMRMGLMPLDGVVVQSAHTVACFAAGCLDSTPDEFDNNWASEVLNANKNTDNVCTFPGKFPDDAQARCTAPFDLELAGRQDTGPMMDLLAGNTNSRTELTKRIVQTQGPYGYGGGPLWRVNLCGKRAPCRRDQFSYFHMFATSYFRLTSLGLPKGWDGYKFSGSVSTNNGNGASDDTPQQRNDRMTAWDRAYTFIGQWWDRWRN